MGLLLSTPLPFLIRSLTFDVFLIVVLSSVFHSLENCLLLLYIITVFFNSFISVLRFFLFSVNFLIKFSSCGKFNGKDLQRACVLLSILCFNSLEMIYCLLQYSLDVLFSFPCNTFLIFRTRVVAIGAQFP